MAYGDLDNDGDQDAVVNNFNDPASIYKNTTSDKNIGHYLQVSLKGPKAIRMVWVQSSASLVVKASNSRNSGQCEDSSPPATIKCILESPKETR